MSLSCQKRSWFSRLNPFARPMTQTLSRRPTVSQSSFRPMLEALEDRMLLSISPVGDATVYPARAVVQIESTFANGTIEQGTGTMVNQNTVLTAGHMVYNYADGGWAKSIDVVAAKNGDNAPYGVAHMTYEWTFNSFIADDTINSDSHSPGDGDIGFISLDRDLGNLTGWLGFSAASGSNYNVNKYGYPGADGYDGTQMYYDYGPLDGTGAGTASGFAYWSWSKSTMSAIPGESGSSLILDQNGQMGIIGVDETATSSEGFAEVTTQPVINALTNFENAHPPTGTSGALVQLDAPPQTVAAGSYFGLNISAQDGSGNTISAFNGAVTIDIWSGPNGASLVGTTTVDAVNGVAYFSGLSLYTPGTYTLVARGGSMTAVLTDTITVESSFSPPNNNPTFNNPPTQQPTTWLPTTQQPSSPATPDVPPLLIWLNQALGEIEEVDANDTTITDSLFGMSLVETYNSSGNLESLTWGGFNVLPLLSPYMDL